MPRVGGKSWYHFQLCLVNLHLSPGATYLSTRTRDEEETPRLTQSKDMFVNSKCENDSLMFNLGCRSGVSLSLSQHDKLCTQKPRFYFFDALFYSPLLHLIHFWHIDSFTHSVENVMWYMAAYIAPFGTSAQAAVLSIHTQHHGQFGVQYRVLGCFVLQWSGTELSRCPGGVKKEATQHYTEKFEKQEQQCDF